MSEWLKIEIDTPAGLPFGDNKVWFSMDYVSGIRVYDGTGLEVTCARGTVYNFSNVRSAVVEHACPPDESTQCFPCRATGDGECE